MQWIADRFFFAAGAWIDAASGRNVRLRVLDPGRGDEIAWSEECARLATSRHPLLNPLIDYGAGPHGSRFEAYDVRDPVPLRAQGSLAERALCHVTQFLRAFDIAMPSDRASCALRPVVSGHAGWRRPLGLTLQPRPALEALEEALDGSSSAGPAVVNVSGVEHVGLRTLRTLAARSARLRGFVPVTAAATARYPELLDAVRERHSCVFDEVDERGRSAATVAVLISTLAAASPRRHVVIRFRRERFGASRSIRLEPLSVRALVAMVFAPGDFGPGESELLEAARESDGLPGLLATRLSGMARAGSRYLLVHETSPAYGVDPTGPGAPPVIAGRVLGSALRARERASAMAGRGRHASAGRLLRRAIRVLNGRGRHVEAAACAVQLGWLALDRGLTAAARLDFDEARRLAGETATGLEATVGLGAALIDDDRLVEAEGVLRGALAAAETVHDTPAASMAAAALGRCLIWQARPEEAIAVASIRESADASALHGMRLLTTRARALARSGRTGDAIEAARAAQRGAAGDCGRAQTSAELALAEALAGAGDIPGACAAVSRAIRLARMHHLPLARVRAFLLLARIDPQRKPARTVARLRRVNLPPLLSRRLGEVGGRPPHPRIEPVAELERLLDLSQRQADDATAASEICKAVGERLGAGSVAIFSGEETAVAVHGRGWLGAPLVARQALAQGTPQTEHRREPQESAEPIRYGGEVIAALACRWPAGALLDVDGAATLLRAAALSAAPYVRAMLDRPAPPPAAAWGDLLGESAAAAALRDAVARAARAPFPVLVEGESGCGKELVARAIHRLSARRDRRFCALNCAALTDDLVETELFGHSRGAFTGAAAERAGMFEEAAGGTLFMDEVAELSARAQAKLLRVLQEGEVRRVGENFARRVDVRVVAATNRRLEEEVAAARFRADLRFRLDVVRIAVPPLRERASDIPLLAAHFWQDVSARVGSRAALSREALAALARYDWPGNVRELQNVVAWIAVQSPRRGRIGPSALPRHVAQATVVAPCSFEAARAEFERRFVRAALAGANGRRSRAAEALGVTRQGLAKMMRRLEIDGA